MRKRFCMILPAVAGALMMNCSAAGAAEHSSFLYGSECWQSDSCHGCKASDIILPPEGMVADSLDNGLGYVLMKNDSPSRMIECRLIFKAGSVLEDDGNRGAAHFLEHMAFGGTRHFPGRKLVDYLESVGAQYGVNINAFTGYDRTVYMFSIPSDDPDCLDNALLILRDWLCDITIGARKVEGEKGIILEELRCYDIGDDFYDLKIGTGAYSKGIPLGTAEDISRMTPEVLKDFHDTWYTPDRATVAIVGDIDVKDVEERIGRVFGGMMAVPSPECPEIPLEYAQGTSVKNVGDTLARSMTVEVMIPHKAVMKGTLTEAVLSGRNDMLVRAISNRLRETGISATVSNSWYLADKEHFVISVSGEGKQEVSSILHDALAEIIRLSRDGFHEGELELLKGYASRVRMAYSGNSATICNEVEDAVLFNDWSVTDSSQITHVNDALESTVSADLQEILSGWLEDAGKSMLAAVRYNPLLTAGLSAAEVDSIWEEASSTVLDPYVFVEVEPEEGECRRTVIPSFLLQQREYSPELVYKRTFFPDIGVTDVMLRNGFRFVLRPTDDEEDKVQMQFFAPGGLSRVPEEDFALYEGMAGYMELGGIEGMDDDAYFSILSENGVGLLLAIESYWHGMIASAPSSSLRLMLNLVHERMLRPSLDRDGFEEIRADELEDFGEESYLSMLMKADVQRQLNMQIDSLMGNLMYGRRTQVTRADLERLNLDTLASVYRGLFSNPSGMTCVVCGSFEVDDFLREAVPVFGSMSPGNEPNRMGESHFTLPETTRKIEYPNANETQTLFDYIRFGHYEPSLRSGLKLKLMNNLIRNRLLTVLREQESLVYSPYTALFYTANPDRVFYIDINASVDRKNTSRVHEVLDEIIEELQRKKVSDRELETLKKIFIVNKRTYLEEDATSNWKGYLVKQMKNDETLAELDMYEAVLASITAKELRDEFRRCFDTDRFMILSIGPFDE